MAKSPPNFLRKGRPTTIRSACSATASSTRAAPTSRAWMSVVSSRQPALSAMVSARSRTAAAASLSLAMSSDRSCDQSTSTMWTPARLPLVGPRKLARGSDHECIGGAAVEADDDTSRGGLGRGHRPERYHRWQAASAGRVRSARGRFRLWPARGWLARRHIGLAPVWDRRDDRIRSAEEGALEPVGDLVVEESAPTSGARRTPGARRW